MLCMFILSRTLLEERSMKRICALVSVACTVATASTVLAQNATTSVRGLIRDPSGAVVSGAKVQLVNKAAGQTLNATSRGSGEYQLQQIQPATYDITVTMAGFGSQTKRAELLVNQPATVDFTLSLQASDVVVNVTEASGHDQSDGRLDRQLDG